MSKCFSVVILSALLLLLASNLCCGGASSAGSPTAPSPPILPHPLQFRNGSWSIFVDGNHMKFSVTGYGKKEVQSAFARFCARTFVHQAAELNVTSVGEVEISVTTPNTDLQLGVDEFYILKIDSMQISILSHTVFGAYHALETLSQLIGFNFDKEQYEIRDTPWFIADAPRFSHRGILIDTSRHFLPLPTLRNVVDSLTYAKFNTLHWHLVDAESFPFDSPTYPQLGRYSSYTAHERYNRLRHEEHRRVREGTRRASDGGVRRPRPHRRHVQGHARDMPASPLLRPRGWELGAGPDEREDVRSGGWRDQGTLPPSSRRSCFTWAGTRSTTSAGSSTRTS